MVNFDNEIINVFVNIFKFMLGVSFDIRKKFNSLVFGKGRRLLIENLLVLFKFIIK